MVGQDKDTGCGRLELGAQNDGGFERQKQWMGEGRVPERMQGHGMFVRIRTVWQG